MNKKMKIIIISILMLLAPVVVMFFSFESEPLETLVAFVCGGSCFLGFCLLSLILIGFYDEDKNKSIHSSSIYKDNIDKDGNKLSYWKIIRGNLLILFIPTFLSTIMILFEGISFLKSCFSFYFIAIIAFIFMTFVCGKENFKRVVLVNSIMSIIIIILNFMPIPYDMGKDIIETNVFVNKMKNYGFYIEQVNELDNIDVMNSDVYFASKDNINVYYVVSDNNQISKRIYDSLDDLFSVCPYGGYESINGYNIRRGCEDPDYLKNFSRVKNTVLYFDTNDENREFVKDLLIEFGYNY